VSLRQADLRALYTPAGMATILKGLLCHFPAYTRQVHGNSAASARKLSNTVLFWGSCSTNMFQYRTVDSSRSRKPIPGYMHVWSRLQSPSSRPVPHSRVLGLNSHDSLSGCGAELTFYWRSLEVVMARISHDPGQIVRVL
jgi:hypothetical protein